MPSSLQSLPAELRNRIWELVMPPMNSFMDPHELHRPEAYPPPVTRTCRLFRSETLKMFLCGRDFTVEIADHALATNATHDFSSSYGVEPLLCWLDIADSDTHEFVGSLKVVLCVTINRWPEDFDVQKEKICWLRDKLQAKGYEAHHHSWLEIMPMPDGEWIDDVESDHGRACMFKLQAAFEELGIWMRFPYW